MNLEARAALQKRILEEEGLRLKPYADSRGFLTIGVGRNIQVKGISQDEALYLLQNDLMDADHDCTKYIPCYAALDDARKTVLVDMCFEMGIDGLLEFGGFLGLMANAEWQQAAADMLLTKWAAEVPSRAQALAVIVRSGVLS